LGKSGCHDGNIDRIEGIRGPELVVGRYAVNGVINIITRIHPRLRVLGEFGVAPGAGLWLIRYAQIP